MSGRWILIDGSTIEVAGAKGTSYRLHLAWDWVSQTIVEWIITDEKTGESLKLYEIQVADTVIADRGYAKFKDLKYVLGSGGEVIIRVAPHVLPLVDWHGAVLKLADELWGSADNCVSRQVAMKADPDKQPMFLHAFRLPPEKAAQARRGENSQSAKKRGYFEKGNIRICRMGDNSDELHAGTNQCRVDSAALQVALADRNGHQTLEKRGGNRPFKREQGKQDFRSLFVGKEFVCVADCQAKLANEVSQRT